MNVKEVIESPMLTDREKAEQLAVKAWELYDSQSPRKSITIAQLSTTFAVLATTE